jgi:hypothetical protein
MLEDIDRHALFNELHRSIEQSATVTVEQLMAGSPDLSYPPNHGLTAEEEAALATIDKTPAMASALRKLIADSAAAPIFELLCLVEGVTDAEIPEDVQEADERVKELMLHDGFNESYWAWRRRRPDPGWKLDTYEE